MAERRRVQSVDALRGLVMIIMALDHTRDFFHVGAMSASPEDLTKTTAVLFLTRWITHFCAPVFMFCAGLGSFLWLRGGQRTKTALSKYLVLRGLGLVVLEVTALRFAMFFSLTNAPWLLTVLWALGWSMVVLAGLIWVPQRWLTALSLVVIFGHNLTDGVRPEAFGTFGWMWKVLHQPGVIPVGGTVAVTVYPLMPWFAVMAAGFCFGPVLEWETARRRLWMLRAGLSMTAGFVVLRGIDVYGDPLRWSESWLSFLKVTKYPPSLDFLLMTLGPALLVLAWFEGRTFGKANPLMVFGKTPLFYFLGHFYLLHLLAIPLALVRYGHAEFLWNPLPSIGGSVALYPAGYGYSLAEVYVIWALVVAGMYGVCRWYGTLRV